MMKTKELIKDIKGTFKLPIKKYYLGRIVHGAPYFYPRNFNKNIIFFRKLELTSQEELDKLPNDYLKKAKRFKNIPMVRRSKDFIFKLFDNYYYLELGYPICYKFLELGWKDKWESPRLEWPPAFYIFFFKWQFCIWWANPCGDIDNYWEQILWFMKYSDKDIVKAEKTWPWTNALNDEKLSTWDDQYLIK